MPNLVGFSYSGLHNITLTIVGKACGSDPCAQSYTIPIFIEGSVAQPLNCQELDLALKLETETWGCHVSLEAFVDHPHLFGTIATGTSTIDFGDGSPTVNGNHMYLSRNLGTPNWDVGVAASHTYSQSGIYNICWTYTYRSNNDSCVETVCKQVAISCDPVNCMVESSFTYNVDTMPNGAPLYPCGVVITMDPQPSTTTVPNNFMTYTYHWGDGTSDGPVKQTVMGHMYATPGAYNVTVTVNDGFWCSSTSTVYDIGILKGCGPPKTSGSETGLLEKETEAALELSVFPNPFTQQSTFKFELFEAHESVDLVIYNGAGQVVAHVLDNQPLDAGKQEIIFNSGELPAGSYFYRLTLDRSHSPANGLLMKSE